MKSFIIIGIGRFGNALARELYKAGHEVLVVDENPEKIQKISDNVTHAVCGNATDVDVLEAVGARNFDCGIVALANNIQDSILITLTLKEMGVNYVITKARDEMHSKVLEKIGADKVVFPEKEMGERLAQIVDMKNVIDYLELSDSHSIMEINTPSSWINKTLLDIDVRAKYGITVIAVREGNSGALEVSLGPDFVMTKGSVMIVLGANEDIDLVGNL